MRPCKSSCRLAALLAAALTPTLAHAIGGGGKSGGIVVALMGIVLVSAGVLTGAIIGLVRSRGDASHGPSDDMKRALAGAALGDAAGSVATVVLFGLDALAAFGFFVYCLVPALICGAVVAITAQAFKPRPSPDEGEDSL